MLAPGLTPLDFLWCWMKNEVYIINIDTTDDLLAAILDAAACVKKCEDKLRRTTRDLRTRVAKFAEVEGGIFEYLF